MGFLQHGVSALGTRVSFLVLPWLMLAQPASPREVVIVSAVQVLAYLVAHQAAKRLAAILSGRAAGRLGDIGLLADLASALVLAAIAFALSSPVMLAGLAAVLGALRALAPDRVYGGRAKAASAIPANGGGAQTASAVPADGGRANAASAVPTDGSLTRAAAWFSGDLAYLAVAGAAIGVASVWLGPMGALWANAMLFAVAALVRVISPADDAPADTAPAAVAFGAALLTQAAAVLLVVLWARDVARAPELLGFIAAGFIVGMIRHPGLAAGTLAGGGVYLVLTGQRPLAGMLVAVAAVVIGVAVASVTPASPPAVGYLGIPLGTAAAWLLPHASAPAAIGAGAAALIASMLIQIRLMPRGAAVVDGQPAELTVTLAYANGQWLVEARRGDTLLGRRHAVGSAEALNLLSQLNVPAIRDSVEKAEAAL